INRTWDSRWYAEGGEYSTMLHEDIHIRKVLRKRLSQAGVAKIVIERPAKRARVTIHTARPGVVIGKKGADIEKLRADLAKMTKGEVALNIVEIRKPEIDATLIAENIAQQLERRVAFRRAMKRAVQSAMRLGAQGIRINCSGRLGGAEIARMERRRQGRLQPRLRLVRPEGDGARPPDRAPDRGRPSRHHAPHEARRPRLDPRLPGRAGVEEAGRGPHGLRQGRARVLGGARQARP